jgi:peptidoglycan/xylan/chitin deacetylase (PgdA/CDA1 family)
LLVLMYHRASAGAYGNPVEMLDAHFEVLARRYRCVLPGEPLEHGKLNVCLSFDDGYFDFLVEVMPLLDKHGLRAVLAVPITVLRESVDEPVAARLQVCAERRDGIEARGGHCTWQELAQIAATGSVAIAAHGFSHQRLDRPALDLQAEIELPRTLLAERTGQKVESFVLPYGRFSAEALAYAKQRYRYVFRIGSADNAGWDAKVLYRVDADQMPTPDFLFSKHRMAGYRFRRSWNAVRGR